MQTITQEPPATQKAFELGIYSFVENTPDPSTNSKISPENRLKDLLEEIELADQVGLDAFGIGEHHREEYLASSPALIPAAAAASCQGRTWQTVGLSGLELTSRSCSTIIKSDPFSKGNPMSELTPAQHQHFLEHGFVVVPQLFSDQEVAFYREHYTRMRLESKYPYDDAGVNSSADDPLKKYPRMIHMHRWDQASLDYLLEPRIREILVAFVGTDPYAVQTMLYFKPAGARGQALHQDNFYLRVQPGTCLAAWTALDDCDEENGCMQMVAGSQNWDLLCPVTADTSTSFTDTTVPLPEGATVQPIHMKAGDTLFFNGSIVHGSFPNTSKDRFRRSLIAHYVQGDAEQIGRWYNPVMQMDGRMIELKDSPGATKCGEWVEQSGQQVIAMNSSYVVEINVHD